METILCRRAKREKKNIWGEAVERRDRHAMALRSRDKICNFVAKGGYFASVRFG